MLLFVIIDRKGKDLMQQKDILFFLKKNKSLLEENFGVEKIGLFGSYARGEATETSDIDLLVKFKYVSFTNFFRLQQYLEQKLMKKIDLGTKLRPYIKQQVESEIIYV